MNGVRQKCEKYQRKVNIRDRITLGCSGFTMMELITAIAIMGIFAGIAFYIYTSYISKAEVTVAVSTLDNVKKTLMTFNLDNGKYPVSINFPVV